MGSCDMKEKELFKTVLFGGYKKSDVLEYVMNIEDRHESEKMKLQQDAEEATQRCEKMREDCLNALAEKESLQKQLEDALEEMADLKAEHEKSLKKNADAQKDLQKLEALRSRCEYLEKQLEDADQRLKEANTKTAAASGKGKMVSVDELLLLKEHMKDIIEEYKQETNKALRDMREASLEECRRLKQQNSQMEEQLEDIMLEVKELTGQLEDKENALSKAERQKEAVMQRLQSVAGQDKAEPDEDDGEDDDKIIPWQKDILSAEEETGEWTETRKNDELRNCFVHTRSRMDALMKNTSRMIDDLFSSAVR